jgi:hypothetical protein
MIETRQLNSSDTDAFIALVKTRPQTFTGFSDDAFQESITVNILNWLSDPLCFCIGVFNDAEMTGAMVAIESQYSPSWTWAYWVSKVGMVGAIFDKNSANPGEGIKTFRELDKLLFDEMETKRGLTRFFLALRDIPSSTALRSSRSADRFWTVTKRLNLFTSRYEIYDDVFIPADSMPKYEYQKQIIGNRTWPIDLAIKMCVLLK